MKNKIKKRLKTRDCFNKIKKNKKAVMSNFMRIVMSIVFLILMIAAVYYILNNVTG